MSASPLEEFLARLYTDRDLLERFLADRASIARTVGLDEPEVAAMLAADGPGLRMAADSYARKRASRNSRRPNSRWSRLTRLLRGAVV